MKLGFKIPKNALKTAVKQKKEGYGSDLELEPGMYSGAIVSGRGVDTKNGPQIVIDVRMGGEELDEDQQGGRISLWFSLEENRFIHFINLIYMLGYELSDDPAQEEIEEILGEIVGEKPVVRIKVSQNGEYINYRADRLLEDMSYDELFPDGEEPEDEESDEEEEEDDEEESDDDLHGVREMSRADMKKFIKKHNMSVKVMKSDTEETLAEKIINSSDYPPM